MDLLEQSLRDLATRSRAGAFCHALVCTVAIACSSLQLLHPAGTALFVCLQLLLGLIRYMLSSEAVAGLVTDWPAWQSRYAVATGVVALSLGTGAGTTLFLTDDAYVWTLVLLAHLGLVGAEVAILSSRLSLQRVFLLLAGLPLLGATLWHGGLTGLAVLCALYLVLGWVLGGTFCRWYTAGLRDALDMGAQTAQLSLSQRTAEEVAERLTMANERLNQQADELRRVTQLNSNLLDAAAQGILGIDPGGVVIFANPAAANLLQRPTLRGQTLRGLLHAADDKCQASCPHVTDIVQGGPPLTARFYRPDGANFPAEVSASAIHVDGGVGHVLIFKDIADRMAVERMKDEFVSVVSHELRTPLTAIKAPLGLLAGGYLGTLTDKGQRMLEVAVANTERLIRLVNDILDYERLASGKALLEPAAVQISELLAQTEILVRPLLAQAEVTLVQIADPGTIVVDPSRIVQVLTNLIGNAIKFSPAGAAIGLTVRLAPPNVTFEVTDQGRGIPAEQVEKIFERFHQVDGSDARDKGGTGLGLAISRSIVQRHGGRIWVESKLGKGSSFIFSLPVGAVPNS